MRNRALAEVTHIDDFIVSDKLTSLMLSQISERDVVSPRMIGTATLASSFGS